MNYTKRTPCADCPFLQFNASHYNPERLAGFASGAFPCHKTAVLTGGEFTAAKNSQHCAGVLIVLEKAGQPNQMMRIAERLGMYDASALDMDADVIDFEEVYL